MPAACDSGVKEPSRPITNPWMLLLPGVSTYRYFASLLMAASSGLLPVPVDAVTPSAFNSFIFPLNPTASRQNDKCLAKWMRVPRGPGTRLERDASGFDAGWFRSGVQRV